MGRETGVPERAQKGGRSNEREDGSPAREVRRRARQYRRRREGRLNGALSVCSLLLLTGIGTLCRDAQTPGLALAAQGFGSVLLRRGAGRYAVIGIAAFAAARR